MHTSDDSSRLCLACGLCCDGTLFADVKLQPGDAGARLQELGLPLRQGADAGGRSTVKFRQPCPALGVDCRCGIYPERPAGCRQFECGVLRSVKSGETSFPAALGQIHDAHRLRDAVRAGLRQLGDDAEGLALSLRFQRTKVRIELGCPPGAIDWEGTMDQFAELTLAVSALQFTLSRDFHSGASC